MVRISSKVAASFPLPGPEITDMRIVVCVKEVLDPDAVGAYALAGKLEIGDDSKSLTQTTIPRLMNAYDEQAIEAALRLRDGGADATVCAVSVGDDLTTMLRHAKSLGVDEVVAIAPPAGADGHVVAALLAAFVRDRGADLVLFGRQASDDDQGVVPALVGEALAMAVVTVARQVELAGAAVRVTRVTPDGDEVVEADLPAVVTVSSELGEPRYPTVPMRMQARKVTPDQVDPGELPVGAEDLAPLVVLERQWVPEVKGECEFLAGETAAELADALVGRLVADKTLKTGGA